MKVRNLRNFRMRVLESGISCLAMALILAAPAWADDAGIGTGGAETGGGGGGVVVGVSNGMSTGTKKFGRV